VQARFYSMDEGQRAPALLGWATRGGLEAAYAVGNSPVGLLVSPEVARKRPWGQFGNKLK